MREMRWTGEQVAALTAGGHVLLAASAGTGKTTTIVGRILWLLGLDVGTRRADGEPVPPCAEPCSLAEIAAITFTEKAACDLKRKLRSAIEESERAAELRWEIDRASVGTIHGFCAELLRDHALRLGIDPTFRILDERESRVRLGRIVRDLLYEALEADDRGAVDLVGRFGLYGSRPGSGAVDRVVEALRDVRWRSRRYEAWVRDGELDTDLLRGLGAEWDDAADGEAARLAAALYRLAREAAHRWLAWMEEENRRDFDSLILDARRLLQRESTRPALDAIRRRYRILIIDEFQDTDAAQRDIAFGLAGIPGDDAEVPPPEPGRRPQLYLVGDPKQSIYRFRGADISVWNAVERRLCPDEGPLALTVNFRSEPAVVEWVNRAGERALKETGREVAEAFPEHRVRYRALVPDRPATPAGAAEWLATDGPGGAEERRRREGRLVAARVRALVGRAEVVDPEDGRRRPCAWRDIALLGRTRRALAAVEDGLREHGVPYYHTAAGDLGGRQEILDAVTALRLLDNPHDELRLFAWLRSPFVGLRDEVLARIRLDPEITGGSLAARARRFLEGSEWPPAPEHRAVAEVERAALQRGLDALRDAQRLAERADAAELLEELLERTGYRLHLLLREGAAEALVNLERFLSLLQEYRHLSVGDFLEMWDRWGEQDLGVPQAPLFSEDDDVVTLSTVHAAKGLEWPVVVLLDTGARLVHKGLLANSWICDPRLGPLLLPPESDRGPRGERLLDRELRQERAEEARLLYVAATRARDRLIVAGPADEDPGDSYAAWLLPALREPVEVAVDELTPAGEPGGGSPPPWEDPATGTGRQTDAFGFDWDPEDEEGQFDLFGAAPVGAVGEESTGAAGEEAGRTDAALPPAGGRALLIRRAGPGVEGGAAAPVTLEWLEGIEPREPSRLVQPLELPTPGFLTSATELRLRERHPEEWELRYRHGVEPPRQFAPEPGRTDALPATLRGTVIHGVLERIEEARDLARVLAETIGGIDAPELEEVLAPGTAYRQALEAEIRRVVEGEAWRWYVSVPHWRELEFVRFTPEGVWRRGAFDLYRPAAAAPRPPGEAESGPETPLVRTAPADAAGIRQLFGTAADGFGSTRPADAATWVVDFKTHRIGAGEGRATAREYAVQAAVYRDAARALGSSGAARAPEVRVALHFTHPNVAVELSESGERDGHG